MNIGHMEYFHSVMTQAVMISILDKCQSYIKNNKDYNGEIVSAEDLKLTPMESLIYQTLRYNMANIYGNYPKVTTIQMEAKLAMTCEVRPLEPKSFPNPGGC